MATNYIVDYQGCRIADYDNTCIVLSIGSPGQFGCGAVYARIWRADGGRNEYWIAGPKQSARLGQNTPDLDNPEPPDIRLISEL